jgi:hypothetical protein
MSAWEDNLAAIEAAALDAATFGELVIRAMDATEIFAIFDPAPTQTPERFPSENGGRDGYDQPQPPTLYAAPSDVADWEDREPLSIRGLDYVITRIDRSDSSETRLLLRRA